MHLPVHAGRCSRPRSRRALPVPGSWAGHPTESSCLDCSGGHVAVTLAKPTGHLTDKHVFSPMPVLAFAWKHLTRGEGRGFWTEPGRKPDFHDARLRTLALALPGAFDRGPSESISLFFSDIGLRILLDRNLIAPTGLAPERKTKTYWRRSLSATCPPRSAGVEQSAKLQGEVARLSEPPRRQHLASVPSTRFCQRSGPAHVSRSAALPHS